MDAYFHNLHSQGLGRIKHAEIITPEEEEQQWKSGIMNSTTHKGLQNAVFHLVGKAFCLRGDAEQRNLSLNAVKTAMCTMRTPLKQKWQFQTATP